MASISAGRGTSFQSIVAKVDGIPYSGFTEISWGDSVEEALGYGMGVAGRPTRRSHGRYTPDECTVKGFRPDMVKFLQQLTAKSGPSRSYSAAEFVFIVSFAFTDAEPVSTVVLDRCRVLSVSESHTDGSDLSEMELKFRPMTIERDSMGGWDHLPQL